MNKTFYFLMPVWGARYVGYLLTYGLNTLLASGNLPAVASLRNCRFIFLTTKEDEQAIRKSTLYSKLDQLMDVTFIHILGLQTEVDNDDRLLKFNQLSYALKRGAEEALGKGYCLFLHPDGLYSNGMLSYLDMLANQGVEAVVGCGPVISEELFESYMSELGCLSYDKTMEISSHEMVGYFAAAAHPDMLAHMPDNVSFSDNPYMGIWKGPKKGSYLLRVFSLHPWLIDFSDRESVVGFEAIDHNFIIANGFQKSRLHIERDSDNFLVLGVKPTLEMNAVPGQALDRNIDESFTRGIFGLSNIEFHRQNFLAGICLHDSDKPDDWETFENLNENYIRKLIVEGRPIWPVRMVKTLKGILFHNAVYYHIEAFFRYSVILRQPGLAIRKIATVIVRNLGISN